MTDMPQRINWSDVSAEVRALNPAVFPTAPTVEPLTYPTKGDVKSHKELQRLAEQEISRRGVRQQLHLSDMTRKKKVGWPDSVFVLRGIPVAIEYKIAPDKLSKEQESVIHDMEIDGWWVFVCYSFDNVVGVLNGIELQAKESVRESLNAVDALNSKEQAK